MNVKTILVIDIDDTFRTIFLEFLELLGFHAIGADSGAVGLQQAKAYLPDLIVCELLMPGLDGYRVLKALQQDPQTMQIPFVFLSIVTSHAAIQKGLELGAKDFLIKPITIDHLTQVIAKYLDQEEYPSPCHELLNCSYPD